MEHFNEYYPGLTVFDLTKQKQLEEFVDAIGKCVGVINYDLCFRRPYLAYLTDFTLMLDESSMISNETAKRSKFVLRLHFKNVILLSGTPTDGKYEKLWSQCQLLGWPITKERFYDHYVKSEWIMDPAIGFPMQRITGYKNVERLKSKLAQHGAIFMKTEEVMDLPEQQEIIVRVPSSKEYRRFMKDRIITVEDRQLIGDTSLTKRIYARELCGPFCKEKLETFTDLLNSTSDRLIVFYNFNLEYEELRKICESEGRPVSVMNGHEKDLTAYETQTDSVTLIQYQSGAMGMNLQLANKVIYFTLPERSELFEQSKKRIHRIGQDRPCFYYILLCKGSVEKHILETLRMRKDYTDALFEKYLEGEEI